jgi:hypothetical protein
MLYFSYFINVNVFYNIYLFIYICMLMLDIGEHLFVDVGFSYALCPM